MVEMVVKVVTGLEVVKLVMVTQVEMVRGGGTSMAQVASSLQMVQVLILPQLVGPTIPSPSIKPLKNAQCNHVK